MKVCRKSLVSLCHLSLMPNVLKGLFQWRPFQTWGLHLQTTWQFTLQACQSFANNMTVHPQDLKRHPRWHEFSAKLMVYEWFTWMSWVHCFALHLRILSQISNLWISQFLSSSSWLFNLPENSQLNLWFMKEALQWSRFSALHFTWEFLSKTTLIILCL